MPPDVDVTADGGMFPVIGGVPQKSYGIIVIVAAK